MEVVINIQQGGGGPIWHSFGIRGWPPNFCLIPYMEPVPTIQLLSSQKKFWVTILWPPPIKTKTNYEQIYPFVSNSWWKIWTFPPFWLFLYKISGVATIAQGKICQRDFCPMTQLSKETIDQWDFCPRKLLQVKSFLRIIFVFSIESYHIHWL